MLCLVFAVGYKEKCLIGSNRNRLTEIGNASSVNALIGGNLFFVVVVVVELYLEVPSYQKA